MNHLDQRRVISLAVSEGFARMSDMTARVSATDKAFHVEGYEKIEYDLLYVDGVFDVGRPDLADSYRPYGRALMVIDETVYALYGERSTGYFDHHDIALTVVPVQIRETAKSLETFERIVGEFDAFGLVRTEPVLVVGGGLTTDVAGFACASYRRNTPYIRIPTTLIGLIDASVSIKVAVNYGKHKNRLGAYHASQQVFLDFSFLKTLPERPGAQRHGRAHQDRGGRQRRDLRAARTARAGTACHPIRSPRRHTRNCARVGDRLTYRRSRPCWSSRRRTCTRSTSTG